MCSRAQVADISNKMNYIASNVFITLFVLGIFLAGCSEPPAESVNKEALIQEVIKAVQSGDETVIQISEVLITDDDLDHFASLDTLEQLILDTSSITDDGMRKLAALKDLIHLRIRNGNITDAGLSHILGLNKLKFLNLPHAELSDDAIKTLKRLPDLQLLRLGSSKMTNDSLHHIAQMESLLFVHLIDVPINDVGLKHLHQMTQLQSLYIDGGDVTDDGLSDLMTALPDLHLHINQQHHDLVKADHDH